MPSFTVTLYGLFLGDSDTMTGWYRKGYVYQSITMAIVPRSAALVLASVGTYCRLDAVGFTNYDVQEGDVVKDSFGDHWEVAAKKPHTWGDEFSHYEVDLKKLLHFPFTAGFFGFETYEVNVPPVSGEFETGFERGYWAL